MSAQTGCTACFSAEDANAVLAALDDSVKTAVLVDESHFQVTLGQCQVCPQLFVSVFTEAIDWDHGNDPQYRAWVPVAAAEAAGLQAAAGAAGLDARLLGQLAAGRRSVESYRPAAGSPRVTWRYGRLLVMEPS